MWRTFSVIAAGTAVLVGTLLLMGNQQNAAARAIQLEQSRLDALARHWETQLAQARSSLRDQVVRHDLLAMLYHPEDWSSWRVQSKFMAMRHAWSSENGTLRAVALINPDGRVHTVEGDSARLFDALVLLRNTDIADAAFLSHVGTLPAVLALQFCVSPTIPSAKAARIITLVDPNTLLMPFSDTPAGWTLLSAPDRELMSSGGSTRLPLISDLMWTLMASQRSGIVRSPDGSTVTFARIQSPGMQTVMLVHVIPAHASASVWIAAIASLMGLGVIFVLAWRAKHADVGQSEPAEPLDTEAGGYRQIVQCITDPICVVDETGVVLKANRAAQERLHLRRGRPDETVTVTTTGESLAATEFLQIAGRDPVAAAGECRLSFRNAAWNGVVDASRLYRDEQGRTAVLLHFRAYADRRDEDMMSTPAPSDTSAPDPFSPFPVLWVTPDGLVTAYNEAARKTCSRLENTSLLSDILPGMDARRLTDVIAAGNGSVFQSLFGPRAHEFTVIFDGERVLLYGHPLADSQDVEIEMKQAQENFCSLCALVPAPVLLVDPHEHTVIEANAAAGDLFERASAGLRGQSLDELCAEPWQPTPDSGYFAARTQSGKLVTCTLRYELVKVEGAPVLMMVLDRLPESSPTEVEKAKPGTPESRETSEPEELPVMPTGPGMLITLNATVREVARRLFEKCGRLCETFTDLDDAVFWLIAHDVRPEFLAIDLTDFEEAANWIGDLRERCGDVPCIAFTDGESCSLPGGGVNITLEKPFDLEAVREALDAAHLGSCSLMTV